MKAKYIVLAVSGDSYDRLETLLEDQYTLSTNMTSQELVLDSLSKLKPQAVIIDRSLKGTRELMDFYNTLKVNHPHIRILIYQDEMIDLVKVYVAGEKEIPEEQETNREIQAAAEEVVATVIEEAQPHQEADSEGDGKRSLRGFLRRVVAISDDSYTTSEFMGPGDDLDDWGRTAEATIDIHNYLRKIVVVTGASGGIGKTDVAINLAVHASECGFKTVLCGFNLQNDDIAGRLGLEYRRSKKLMTVFELYSQNRLNISGIEDCLQDYRGLKVLVGIEKPEERQEMDEEFFRDVSRILKANYDLVILDTENNSFSPAYFSVVEIADHVLLPCTTHNSVLAQLRDELYSWKDDFDIPLSKVDIIFNKKGEGGFISRDHIEKHTSREVIAEIPHSKEVLRGSEREEPAVLRHSVDARKIRKELEKVLFRLTGKKVKNVDIAKPRFTIFRKKVSDVAKGLSRG